MADEKKNSSPEVEPVVTEVPSPENPGGRRGDFPDQAGQSEIYCRCH